MISFDNDLASPGKSIYMIAICGTGMTALAGMLKAEGYDVRGSDQNVYPPMSTLLSELGIPVDSGFDAAHLVPKPDLVVIGNAMSRGNPEVEAVLNRKIPYISLPVALRDFFIRGNYSCVVAGTHGKTTTSALLAWVLENAGKDPGFFVGGIPENFGQGYRVGKGGIFVSEGDEYDSAFFDKGSKFLHYMPDLLILNNLEFDHADIFRNYEDVELSFRRLINLVPGEGYIVACWDDPNIRKIAPAAFSELVSFGLSEDADFRATSVTTDVEGTHFEVVLKGETFGRFSSPLFGLHNVRNVLAVIAAAMQLGLSVPQIQRGIATFRNVRRRFQFLGEKNGVKIFDDFAHHPTAIATTIDGMRRRFPGHRVWAMFEPRSATSKRKVFEHELVEALAGADHAIIAPIYMPEKVPENERLDLQAVSRGVQNRQTPCHVLTPDDEMLSFLKSNLKSNDIALFMSNGDFHQIPVKLLHEL
jgi:UDP-N-acetylmuramate: L-alanyl-gamma-D-glutamyl-meso-diaminopimelate ligase